jgi:Cyanophycinase and related exopeptidases
MESILKLTQHCRVVAYYAVACISVVLGVLIPTAFAGDKTTPSYSYFVTGTQYFMTGNPAPVQTLPTPQPQAVQPVVIMGGGPDVDGAYRWMIQQAGITKATGGRMVVIRATGTDAYDPYFYYSNKKNATDIPAVDGYVGGAYLGLTAAETLVITDTAAANDPFVNAVVGSANALWIAGGDQSNYIKFWKGTKLNATIAALMQQNVPVGGTSAGANVLGQFVFSAIEGTVTSTQALSDPYNKYMTFDPKGFSGPSFLNATALDDTFVDPHFDSRARMGRLVTFLSRSIAPWSGSGCEGGVLKNPSAARGIGLDVETALQIQKISGRFIAQRVSNLSTTSPSAVHFLRPLTSPAVCAPGKPLTIYGVHVQRLDDDTAFDMTNWWNGGSAGIEAYVVDENAGIQSPATIHY